MRLLHSHSQKVNYILAFSVFYFEAMGCELVIDNRKIENKKAKHIARKRTNCLMYIKEYMTNTKKGHDIHVSVVCRDWLDFTKHYSKHTNEKIGI